MHNLADVDDCQHAVISSDEMHAERTVQHESAHGKASGAGITEDAGFLKGIEKGRRFIGSQGDVYELLDTIGTGSASIVFRCRRVSTVVRGNNDNLDVLETEIFGDEDLAVKAIDLKSLRLSCNFHVELEKLRKEAQYLRALHHPRIVRFLDYIEAPDAIFLLQEYLKDGELFYKIVEKGCLAEQEACYIAHQLLAAMHYMHSKNVIHRDIKPENILIEKEIEDGFFYVKLADFGLAKLLHPASAAAQTLVGTPQYWAPEVIACGTNQVRDGTYGFEADIWSFGVCLYVMLGGTYPFDERVGPIQSLVLKGQFHFRHGRFARVSDDAKDLIRKCLIVDVARRISEHQIFCHPWMRRWLCKADLELFRFPATKISSFRSMPALPRLTPLNRRYSLADASAQSSAAVSPTGIRPSDALSLINEALTDVDTKTNVQEDVTPVPVVADEVEKHYDSIQQSTPGVISCSHLPTFLCNPNQPIPPFHLPVLLPLQLHLLLLLHTLTLSLRLSPPMLVLVQHLKRRLFSLQQRVHTAVGFFECSASSAIEVVEDISGIADSVASDCEENGRDGAIVEMFSQVKNWVCEMQKEGRRCGSQYEIAEASVHDIIRGVLTSVNATTKDPDVVSERMASEDRSSHAVDAELHQNRSGGMKVIDVDTRTGGNADVESTVAASASLGLRNDVKDSEEVKNPQDVSRNSKSETRVPQDEDADEPDDMKRVELLRHHLAIQINRLVQGCLEPVCVVGGSPVDASGSSEAREIQSAIASWSAVGAFDPAELTSEILDFLFLTSRDASGRVEPIDPRPSRSRVRPCGTERVSSIHSVYSQCPESDAANTGHRPPSGGPCDAANSLNTATKLKMRKEIRGRSESPNAAVNEVMKPEDTSEYAAFEGTRGEFRQQLITSRLSVTLLQKLRQISYILLCVNSFWSNFDVILYRLLQVQQQTETIVRFISYTWMRKRALEKLRRLVLCWREFRTQCRVYIHLARVRDAKIMDLGMQVQMRADQLDAVRALNKMRKGNADCTSTREMEAPGEC